jgi:hypothetical protein
MHGKMRDRSLWALRAIRFNRNRRGQAYKKIATTQPVRRMTFSLRNRLGSNLQNQRISHFCFVLSGIICNQIEDDILSSYSSWIFSCWPGLIAQGERSASTYLLCQPGD